MLKFYDEKVEKLTPKKTRLIPNIYLSVLTFFLDSGNKFVSDQNVIATEIMICQKDGSCKFM